MKYETPQVVSAFPPPAATWNRYPELKGQRRCLVVSISVVSYGITMSAPYSTQISCLALFRSNPTILCQYQIKSINAFGWLYIRSRTGSRVRCRAPVTFESTCRLTCELEEEYWTTPPTDRTILVSWRFCEALRGEAAYMRAWSLSVRDVVGKSTASVRFSEDLVVRE